MNIALLKMKAKASYSLNAYKFKHWAFQWKQDEEGDIVFVVLGVFNFMKYKEHTLFSFGKKSYNPTPKHVKEV